MKMRDYLKETGCPIMVFAKKCGLTLSTIRNHLINNPNQEFKITTCYRIVKASKGKIKYEDLLPANYKDTVGRRRTKKRRDSQAKSAVAQ